MASGQIYSLAVGKQAAEGTPAAAAAYRFGVTGGSLAANRTVNTFPETSTSSQRLARTGFVAGVGVEGSPEIGVRADYIGLLLYAALGAKAVTGAGPYEHVFTPAAALPFLTIWDNLGDLVRREFRDCQIGQLVLTSEAQQPLKATMTIIGKDPRHDSSDSQSAVALSTLPLMMHFGDPAVPGTGGTFEVDGTEVSCIERSVLTINNNVTAIFGDSVYACSLNPGVLDVTLELTHVISDAELYNQFHYNNAAPADAAQESTTLYEPAAGVHVLWGDGTNTLDVAAPRVQLVTLGGYEPNTNGDPVRDTQTYRVFEPDSGAALEATLTNSVATY